MSPSTVQAALLERVRATRSELGRRVLGFLETHSEGVDGTLIELLLNAQSALREVELQLAAELRSVEEPATCAECGRRDDGARGWRALLNAEDDGSQAIALFCAVCAAREF